MDDLQKGITQFPNLNLKLSYSPFNFSIAIWLIIVAMPDNYKIIFFCLMLLLQLTLWSCSSNRLILDPCLPIKTFIALGLSVSNSNSISFNLKKELIFLKIHQTIYLRIKKKNQIINNMNIMSEILENLL